MLAARFYRAISNARAGSGEPPGYALEGRVIVRFAIPALIYMMGNNVMFLALRYLDAPTYQVLGNTKIIVVAVIQRMALGSRKTVVQWCAAAPLSLTPPAAPPASRLLPPGCCQHQQQHQHRSQRRRSAEPPLCDAVRLGVGLLMLGMMVIGASKFDAAAGTSGNENLLAVRPKPAPALPCARRANSRNQTSLVAEPGAERRRCLVCVCAGCVLDVCDRAVLGAGGCLHGVPSQEALLLHGLPEHAALL